MMSRVTIHSNYRNAGLLFIFLVFGLCLISCGDRNRKGAIQGDWYKKGFDKKAMSFIGDSVFYPMLDKGFPYQLKDDTLTINFSEDRFTKSIILSFSSYQMEVWDMSLSKDTIVLQRQPDIIKDTLK